MPAIGNSLSLPQSQAAFSGRFKGRRHAQRRRAKTTGERQHDVACRPQPFTLARKGERLTAEGRDRGVAAEESGGRDGPGLRSEEGRVGQERVSTCRSRWSQHHEQKKKKQRQEV